MSASSIRLRNHARVPTLSLTIAFFKTLPVQQLVTPPAWTLLKGTGSLLVSRLVTQ